ncbi:MAG: polyvinylalcohol dehydrogenase [Planctomycetes bacterium]|nr:polyvinylalcohol dehydrogenase [Planctomycetota bacterium]
MDRRWSATTTPRKARSRFGPSDLGGFGPEPNALNLAQGSHNLNRVTVSESQVQCGGGLMVSQARVPLAGMLLLITASSGFAQLKAMPGEWPGWRGPDRNALSSEKGLLKQWPKGGPPLVWKVTGLGDGYSTPSIAAGTIYLLGTEDGQEVVIALDARDGRRRWATPIGQMAGGYPGPRCTPTIDGKWLYAISSDGKLACMAVSDGKVRWKKDLQSDFAGRCGRWAYTESPLIDGDVLVCTPGGDANTLVALNKDTGQRIWSAAPQGLPGGKRKYTTAAYSSVVSAEIAGTKQYIQFLSGGVIGVSARDGAFLWHYDRPANRTANCSTPIVRDDCVLAASGYGTGGGLARISRNNAGFSADEAYFVNELKTITAA